MQNSGGAQRRGVNKMIIKLVSEIGKEIKYMKSMEFYQAIERCERSYGKGFKN